MDRLRTRHFLPLLALLATAGPSRPQSAPAPSGLAAFDASLPTQPDPFPPELTAGVDDLVQMTDLGTLQQQLPILLSDMDAPQAQLRRLAMLMLFAIESRGQEQRVPDTNARAMLVPYIDRIAPRLHDPESAVGKLTFLVLKGLLFVHPKPPELLQLALEELKRPDATKPRPDPETGAPGHANGTLSRGPGPAWGPNMLWIVLPAGATFEVDPKTAITEGPDSPEVQAAVAAFVQRPDQTPESLAETVRAIALAQPQNPEVNEHLLPLLDTGGIARSLATPEQNHALA